MSTDPNTVIIITTCSILIFLVFVIIVFFIIFRNAKTRILFEKQLLESEVIKSQLEIREDLLQNISMELHDNVGQILSVAKLNLNTLPDSVPNSKMIKETSDLIGESLSEIRHLSRVLNPENIRRLGLEEMLRLEFDRLKTVGHVDCLLEVTGKAFVLPSDVAIILVRIVQEFIKNSLKHAKASQIKLSIRYHLSSLSLNLEDNGIGFDPALVENNKINGLKIMQYRADLIGADFKYHSIINQGTQLNVNYKLIT